MKKIISKFLIFVLLFVSCVSLVACKNGDVELKNNILIEVEYSGETIYSKTIQSSSKNTVFELLSDLKAEDDDFTFVSQNSTYGEYISSINGIDESQEGATYHYWSFYFNDAYAIVGVSSQKLENNCKIKFIYESYTIS